MRITAGRTVPLPRRTDGRPSGAAPPDGSVAVEFARQFVTPTLLCYRAKTHAGGRVHPVEKGIGKMDGDSQRQTSLCWPGRRASTRPNVAFFCAILSCLFIAGPAMGQGSGHGAGQHGQSHAAPARSKGQSHAPAPAPQRSPTAEPHPQVFNDPRTAPPGTQRPLITRGGSATPPAAAPLPPPAASGGGPHLGSWLASHQGQSFQDQIRSLQQEPGFSRLPSGQQQRLVDRLNQIDSMPPARRQRTLERIENMERLSPARKQAVRNAAQELQQMPPGRRQQVQTAFRTLRDLPPAERPRALNSPPYRSQFSDRERNILSNLLSVEPYQPHP
jgi:hypothetical protein